MRLGGHERLPIEPWQPNRGESGERKKKATYRKATCRADHRCSLCGIGGLAENEFAGGESKWANHKHVVFAKGTIDEPDGTAASTSIN